MAQAEREGEKKECKNGLDGISISCCSVCSCLINSRFRGTALSRHTPLQSAQYPKVNSSNNNTNQDDSKPVSVDDNPDDRLSSSTQHLERPQETRRPRVVFADVNRIQFYDDDQDEFDQSTNRRSRFRPSKRSTPLIVPNPSFAPSIQHSQSMHTPSSSLSRHGGVQQELNIKKQPLVASPRIHSSRVNTFTRYCQSIIIDRYTSSRTIHFTT